MSAGPSSSAGGYRYLPGVFQYSAGVAAEPGFTIERARFHQHVSLGDGFQAIAAHLRALGRPLTAFCACELRAPAPFTEAGFEVFNRQYVRALAEWGIGGDGSNPVARSTVCPEIAAPREPAFYAFSYTLPAPATTRKSFVIAGSGEVPEGKSNYRDHIIRRGDLSAEGLRTKAGYVLGEMERRMHALGCGWPDATHTHVYTVHDVHSLLGPEIVRRGAAPGGISWHYARPPVLDIEFEMDVRGVLSERVISP